MVKRKVSEKEEAPVNKSASKKTKKVSDAIETDVTFDSSSPDAVMKSLLHPHKPDMFFKKHWEKEPLHIQREKQEYYGSTFSLDTMKDILLKNELMFEADVNVCRYVNGEKELLNEDGQITVEKFMSLMSEKQATFQFHQPQRYVDVLWNMLEKLETHFGTLVGANVYMTPTESQGLAPHCDDVEVFVMQLEGSKNWKVYKPMVELSRDYTQDLAQDSIGKPLMDITLQPGDLLYLPRGYIHQARTVSDGHSTHLTISTYQANTWGDFMNHAVTQAIENALEDDVSFRSGLPVNYMSFLGTGKNLQKYIEVEKSSDASKLNGHSAESAFSSNEDLKSVISFKEHIKSLLSTLVDHIDVNTAADAMCTDFIANRLPPFGYVSRSDEDPSCVPSLDDYIKIRYPEHVRVVYVAEDDNINMTRFQDEEEDSDDEMEEAEISEEDEEKPTRKSAKKEGPSDEKPAREEAEEKKSKASMETEEEDDDEESDDDATGDPCIKIIHSLSNSREGHMFGDSSSVSASGVKLPLHFASAAHHLLSSGAFVSVRDLPLEDDDDKLFLAASLVSDDLVEVKAK